MRIRTILFLLLAFLGSALVASLFYGIRDQVLQAHHDRRLLAYNDVRATMLVFGDGLQDERVSSYVLMSLPLGDEFSLPRRELSQRLAATRGEIDRRLQAITAKINDGRFWLDSPEVLDRLMAQLRDRLSQLRLSADRRIAAGRPSDIGDWEARQWLTEASNVIGNITSLRLSLIVQARPQDPKAAAASQLRRYVDGLREDVSENYAVLRASIDGRAQLSVWGTRVLVNNNGRVNALWDLIREQRSGIDAELGNAILTLDRKYISSFDPVQAWAIAWAQRNTEAPLDVPRWRAETERFIADLDNVQAGLIADSRLRLERTVDASWTLASLWLALLVASATAIVLAVLVVRRRIVARLASLAQAMLQLAKDDLTVEMPRRDLADEIGAMSEALRVFKATALRRRRLQKDREVLHERLEDAHAQLQKDLSSAAAIQASLLPETATVGFARATGLFLPSTVVAGDTFNIVQQIDGRVAFFLADVAGHGVPAALVSVALHDVLTRSAISRSPSERMEHFVAAINREWPSRYPYFTMIYGEIDPETGICDVVQAGSPAPIVLRRDGAIDILGNGGLPIGLLPEVTHEIVQCRLRPGDRIFLISDGLTEAENAQGEMFSEERVQDILSANVGRPTQALLTELRTALERWKSGAALRDDISVLALDCSFEWAEDILYEAA